MRRLIAVVLLVLALLTPAYATGLFVNYNDGLSLRANTEDVCEGAHNLHGSITIKAPKPHELTSHHLSLKIAWNVEYPINPENTNDQALLIVSATPSCFMPFERTVFLATGMGLGDGEYIVPVQQLTECAGQDVTISVKLVAGFVLQCAAVTVRVTGNALSYVFLGTGLASFICSLCVVVLFLGYPSLQKFPSSIVFIRSLVDLVFSMETVALSITQIAGNLESVCNGGLAFLTQFCLIASLNWYFALTLNFHFSISNPFRKPEAKMRYYHIFSWGVAVVTGIITATNYGFRPDLQLCWNKKYDDVVNIWNWAGYFVWLVLFSFISVVLFIRGQRRLKSSQLLVTEARRQALIQTRTYVAIFTIYWGVAGILWALVYWSTKNAQIVQDEWISFLFAVISGLFGCVDAFAWFYTHWEALKKIQARQRSEKRPRDPESRFELLDKDDSFPPETEDDLSSALRTEFIRATSDGIVYAVNCARMEYERFTHAFELALRPPLGPKEYSSLLQRFPRPSITDSLVDSRANHFLTPTQTDSSYVAPSYISDKVAPATGLGAQQGSVAVELEMQDNITQKRGAAQSISRNRETSHSFSLQREASNSLPKRGPSNSLSVMRKNSVNLPSHLSPEERFRLEQEYIAMTGVDNACEDDWVWGQSKVMMEVAMQGPEQFVANEFDPLDNSISQPLLASPHDDVVMSPSGNYVRVNRVSKAGSINSGAHSVNEGSTTQVVSSNCFSRCLRNIAWFITSICNSDEQLEDTNAPRIIFSYAPHVFRRLRTKVWKIDDEEHARSMTITQPDPSKMKFTEGASGSFFYFNNDSTYMVKTLTEGERDMLLRILPRYYAYMRDNPESLICRFFGLYSIRMYSHTEHFVVMNNLLHNPLHESNIMHERYDLKGSTINRYGKPMKKQSKAYGPYKNLQRVRPDLGVPGTMKDNDLKKSIRIKAPLAVRLRKQLIKDSRFLRDQNIMDYSLLLGIYNTAKSLPSQPIQLMSSIPRSPSSSLSQLNESSETKMACDLQGVESASTLGNSLRSLPRGWTADPKAASVRDSNIMQLPNMLGNTDWVAQAASAVAAATVQTILGVSVNLPTSQSANSIVSTPGQNLSTSSLLAAGTSYYTPSRLAGSVQSNGPNIFGTPRSRVGVVATPGPTLVSSPTVTSTDLDGQAGGPNLVVSPSGQLSTTGGLVRTPSDLLQLSADQVASLQSQIEESLMTQLQNQMRAQVELQTQIQLQAMQHLQLPQQETPHYGVNPYPSGIEAVTFGPHAYFLGIIDVLQEWDLNKRTERCLKIFFKCHCWDKKWLSVVEPNAYQDRFEKMVKGLIDDYSS